MYLKASLKSKTFIRFFLLKYLGYEEFSISDIRLNGSPVKYYFNIKSENSGLIANIWGAINPVEITIERDNRIPSEEDLPSLTVRFFKYLI